VVDWKDYSASSTTEARLQMSLYAWLMCKAPAWRVSLPENIELWEVNLGLPAAHQYKIDQAAFDELEDFMYRSTENLRTLCGGRSLSRGRPRELRVHGKSKLVPILFVSERLQGARTMDRHRINPRNRKMAGATGLEPATSCVTGGRSSLLNYVPAS
jgi:hypothetical protein